MKIVFLDSKTIGDDIDLSEYDKLGEVVKYDFSTTEEAAERTRDADVIVLNIINFSITEWAGFPCTSANKSSL